MIKACLFISGETMVGGQDLVDLWQKDPESMIWLDLCDNDKADEAELLAVYFGIHSLAIQDAQRERHPPKIEAFDDYTFMLLKGLSADSRDIDFETIQLSMFVGRRFLITCHSGPSLSINRLDKILAERVDVHVSSTSKLALQLCRFVAERYLKILLSLESRLEELEKNMLESANDAMLAELINYKSDLKRLHRYATYHEQMFAELKEKKYPCFNDGEHNHEVIDVWEKQERILSLSQLYYEMATDLIDGYISVASHRLNQIMKVLTIVMAVFVPLSFLAGIYGMNFENMPELHSKSGYFILLGVMASIATLLLYIFRKMRWL